MQSSTYLIKRFSADVTMKGFSAFSRYDKMQGLGS